MADQMTVAELAARIVPLCLDGEADPLEGVSFTEGYEPVAGEKLAPGSSVLDEWFGEMDSPEVLEAERYIREAEAHEAPIISHCVLCGHPLRDATSIEYGVGPKCRGASGYEDAYPLTAPMIAALDELAVHVYDNVEIGLGERLLQACHSHTDTRRAANLLVQRLARKCDGPELQGQMLKVLRAMGYDELVRRLAERLFEIRVEVWPEYPRRILCFTPYNPQDRQLKYRLAVKGVWGRKWHGYDEPRVLAWSVPDTPKGKAGLYAALCKGYPGEWAWGPHGAFCIEEV